MLFSGRNRRLTMENQTTFLLRKLLEKQWKNRSFSSTSSDDGLLFQTVWRLVEAFRYQYRPELVSMTKNLDAINVSSETFVSDRRRNPVLNVLKNCVDPLLSCPESLNWGRIVATLAFFSELCQHVVEYYSESCDISELEDVFGELNEEFGRFFDSRTSQWISDNGGWESLLEHEIEMDSTSSVWNKNDNRLYRVMGYVAVGMGITTLLGLIATR